MSYEDAAGTYWDVLVIGGGPAGAVAARQCAAAGHRTLLVDKQSFPRAKVCGACVNARALQLLSLLGLAPGIASLPASPFDRFDLMCGSRRASIVLPPGQAIARGDLDDALVREAIATGATWLPATTATVGDVSDDGACREVALMEVASKRETNVRTRIVLVADGLGSPSLQHCRAEFPSVICQTSRMGVGGVVKCHDGRFADRMIHMAVSQHGYAGIVALADGSLNVAAAIDGGFLKHQGGVAAGLQTILASAGVTSLDLESTRWKGTPPLTRKLERPASTRLLVLGDAAGYVEPFTGEGIAWAITSGAASAAIVPQGLAKWTTRVEDAWLSLSRQLIQQHQFLCRALAWTLRSRRLTSAATIVSALFPAMASRLARRSSLLPTDVEQLLSGVTGSAARRCSTKHLPVSVRTPTGEPPR